MLRYEDCRLREITTFDLDQIIKWRNSESIRTNMFNDHTISPEEHHAWFERQKSDSSIKVHLFEFKNIPAGVVNFSKINLETQSCTWGFYLGSTNLPKGSGLAMGYLALSLAFDELNLCKVYGEAFLFNLASINYHQKLGFIKIDPRFAPIQKNGKFEEVLSLALHHETWGRNKLELKTNLFGDSI